MTLDAHFVEQLGLDSLDAVELVMAFEDEFGSHIRLRRAVNFALGTSCMSHCHARPNRMPGLVIADADAEAILSGAKAVKFILDNQDKIQAKN